MDKPEILIFENGHLLSNFLVKKWIEIANESIGQRNRFTVALSGGRTPVEFYSRLSSLEEFDLWHKTHLFLADEHFVRYEERDNNFRMITENLINYINVPEENLHPILTHYDNVGLAAEHYKEELMYFFGLNRGQWPRFDLMLLGIGDEGHTASLFPDDENVNDPDRLTIPVSLNHLKNERISLTLPVINQARHVLFLVLGRQKAPLIKDILDKKADGPAAKVHPKEGRLIYLLDKEAAQNLSYPDDATTTQDDAIAINIRNT